ncbi:hypothetical protein E2986_02184 [Frieseomelitta varia]|uniref:KIND domain-containing protein n=1 Tax=Frieseomelitta varia TaxID=561572 RepID=A0A833VRL7_9HYME|nr:hypothetical protein E2986_02184 [Frieseomelitta varia]
MKVRHNLCEVQHLQKIRYTCPVRFARLINKSGKPRVSEKKAIFSLGLMIFKALDFGLDEQEERPVSPDLENLITLMTRADQEIEGETEERPQETDDEGIERDSSDADVDEFLSQKSNDTYDERPSLYSLKNVMQLCIRHMQASVESAEIHYKAVIRAFVAEALELSYFLDTVAANKLHASRRESVTDSNKHTSMSVQNLDTLDFIDWIRYLRLIDLTLYCCRLTLGFGGLYKYKLATFNVCNSLYEKARFWVQVIQELRKGVKLKKVEANLSSKNPTRGRGKGVEFELTPYEILMDDIRKRRYHLRKTPSPKPHLRKDAHAVILEFIRSRPPLKKASERQLPPLQKEWTVRELLMESIKKPPNLRPSRNRYVPKSERISPQCVHILYTNNCDVTSMHQSYWLLVHVWYLNKSLFAELIRMMIERVRIIIYDITRLISLCLLSISNGFTVNE